MSEYHTDPDYGRDDYGSNCRTCSDWSPREDADYCSVECEERGQEIVATCGCCGEDYTAEAWLELEYVGIVCSARYRDHKPGEPDDEYRNCQCRSTLIARVACQGVNRRHWPASNCMAVRVS